MRALCASVSQNKLLIDQVSLRGLNQAKDGKLIGLEVKHIVRRRVRFS